MRGNHDDPERQARGYRARLPDGQTTASGAILERAAAGWIRRGYAVRYRDAHLIQLVRAGRPTCLGLLLMLLAIPAVALAILLVVWGMRRRYWHTVSITVTPEERVITHRQWAPYPPEEP